MPLIPLRPLLETVDKYHFAQGAFNVNAVAQAKAAIEVHEMFRSAAILQGGSKEHCGCSEKICRKFTDTGCAPSGPRQKL